MNETDDLSKDLPIISIIIVAYNTKEETLSCIQSIQDKIDIKETPYEVIVSDNGSTDGGPDAVRERFPWVEVMENNANIGFGKANNRAAANAAGDVLFFLNPDTLVVNDIGGMADYIRQHRKVGALNPLIVDAKGGFKDSFDNYKISSYLAFKLINLSFPWPFFRLWGKRHQRNILTMEVFGTERFYGCAFLMRKDTFAEIGHFDENLFMYYEEEDVSFRLKRRGYTCCIYPKSMVIHVGLKTDRGESGHPFTDRDQRMWASERHLLKKHFPHTWAIRYLLDIGITIRASVRLVLKRLSGKGEAGNFNDIICNCTRRIRLAFSVLTRKMQ
ncbi:MAG: glycosyltransferase family 2 protein [Deltaproteobacteria bacterium]|nr:glycosyltransferase family 2 protein [Deltaproteobacteria bacterium]